MSPDTASGPGSRGLAGPTVGPDRGSAGRSGQCICEQDTAGYRVQGTGYNRVQGTGLQGTGQFTVLSRLPDNIVSSTGLTDRLTT